MIQNKHESLIKCGLTRLFEHCTRFKFDLNNEKQRREVVKRAFLLKSAQKTRTIKQKNRNQRRKHHEIYPNQHAKR